MAHWHDFNPWAAVLVYLPDLDELSACLDPADPRRQIKRWEKERGLTTLDAYIIPTPSAVYSCGIRWGAEPESYYSPYINPYIGSLLVTKYREKH